MFRLIPLSLILQAFCMYHAFTNKSEQKWYWIIMIFPVGGSLFYLYHHFYSRQNVDAVSEGVKAVVNTNYAVQKLEKEVEFSDTNANKKLLAAKYMELNRYEDAIELYESCLEGYNIDNPGILTKLVEAYYHLESYKKVIELADKLKEDTKFLKSEEYVFYAWSLFQLDQHELAEKAFLVTDVSYDNYKHRLDYTDFLFQVDRNKEALDKLEVLIDEFKHMSPQGKRLNKAVIKELKILKAGISKV